MELTDTLGAVEADIVHRQRQRPAIALARPADNQLGEHRCHAARAQADDLAVVDKAQAGAGGCLFFLIGFCWFFHRWIFGGRIFFRRIARRRIAPRWLLFRWINSGWVDFFCVIRHSNGNSVSIQIHRQCHA